MEFSGKLLKRGFWLYVWDIKQDLQHHLYVGRTGDTSSPHASSPFLRIGQHLDVRVNARGNALGRRLKTAGIDPESCTFEMTAIGPIFEEQKSMPEHTPYRDKTAVLERALAHELRSRGYNVLGTHPKCGPVDPELWEQVMILLRWSYPSQSRPTRTAPRFQLVRLRGDGPSLTETMLRDRERL